MGIKPVKLCPFLKRSIENTSILHGLVEEFLPCEGKACTAYYPGGCLRLGPATLFVNADRLRPGELEEMVSEIHVAPLKASPFTEPSVEFIQNWIPVSEHLPQEDSPLGVNAELVQVLLKDGTVTAGYYNRGMELWFHLPPHENRLVGHAYDKPPVVTWMAMAKPPQEDI